VGDAATVEGATVSRCGFFLADWVNLAEGLTPAALIGHDTVEIEGQPRNCDVVLAEYPPDDKSRSGHRSRLLCIEPGTGLILRERVETNYPALKRLPAVYRIQTVTLIRIQRDAELEPSLFTFSPPEGSTTNDGSTDDSHRVYSLGDGITPPVLLEKTDPQYPKRVVKAGVEGAVLLKIDVAPDGKAHNIQVVRSLEPDLDRKAVECVERWKFRPGTKDGQTVTVEATVEVNFRIER
jgi:TonB family protein